MINLYIDFDGVILDTINTTYQIMESINLDRSDDENTKKFYSTVDWAHIIEITPEINDALSCIKKIIDSKRFDIAILTHVHSLDELAEKLKFIRYHFNEITVIGVPKLVPKTQMVNAKNSILIDDYAGNLRDWSSAGGIGVRFSLELESKGFHVINKLDQILDIDFSKEVEVNNER
jgi:hypothetical protein